MTNFEKIKAMSIDEMTVLLDTHGLCSDNTTIHDDCDANCDDCIKKWLESEVEQNEENDRKRKID